MDWNGGWMRPRGHNQLASLKVGKRALNSAPGQPRAGGDGLMG